jgi:hypothetical protein
MSDFEEFKAAREKIDPSSREMTDHQWKQAFDAHQRARGRVGGGSGEGRRRRRRSSSQSSQTAPRGQHRPSTLSKTGSLRAAVRADSAYQDLRMMIDMLSWVAIVVVVLGAVVSLFYYTSAAAALVNVLGAVVQVIAIIAARLLIQVLIDIPDIALYRVSRESDAGERSSNDDGA